MSLGHTTQDDLSIKKIDQVKGAARKVAKHPSRAIFFLGLTGLLGGLMFGISFSWQVYVILSGLGVFNMYVSVEEANKAALKKK